MPTPRTTGSLGLALAGLLGFVLGCGSDSGTTLVDHGTCPTLIECASQLNPAVRDEYEATWGEDGSCWQGGPENWQACRDACTMALDVLNQAAMISGQDACGTCATDDDCASFGTGASCVEGVCSGGANESGSGSGSDEAGCATPQSEVCAELLVCLGAAIPDQVDAATAQFGADGPCWCGDQQVADICTQSCTDQLEATHAAFPDVPACGEEPPCSLDPSAPYGPPSNGVCPDYMGMPQMPFVDPFGLSGSYCAPACQGIAESCPPQGQTSAEGTCFINGNPSLCALRCYVDPEVVGGEQCQCGATCVPDGTTDGEGHQRGLCLFQ